MHRTRKIGALTALVLGTAALTGCATTDPYTRAGIWQPFGANDANIAAMAANPADLTRGRGDAPQNLRTAAGAVEKLWQSPSAPPAGSNRQPQAGGTPRQPGPGEAAR